MAEQKTSNEAWRDALIGHLIAMLRFHGTLARNVLSILDVTEAELRDRISRSLHDVVNEGGVDIRKGRAKIRLEALADAISEIRGNAMDKGIDRVIRELRDMARAEPVVLKTEFERIIPVVLDTVTPDAATLRALATNTPFEGRELKQWLSRLKEEDRWRIMNEIRVGLIQGESVDQITRRVIGSAALDGADGATAVTRRAADAVVRTAAAAVGAAARAEFFEANSDVFSLEAWVATLDHRACPRCMALDGKRFEVGVGPFTPLHWRCRCLRVAVIADDGELIGSRPFNPTTEKQLLKEFADDQGFKAPGTRDGLPYGTKGKFDDFARKRVRELIGRVPASQTYEDFLRGQTNAFQDEVLGKTKATLFRSGDLKLNKFVDSKFDHEFTLKQLAQKYKDAFRKAGLDPEEFL